VSAETLGNIRQIAMNALDHLPLYSDSLQIIRVNLAEKLTRVSVLHSSEDAEIVPRVEGLVREVEIPHGGEEDCERDAGDYPVDDRLCAGSIHEMANNSDEMNGEDVHQMSAATFEQWDCSSFQDTPSSFEISEIDMFLSNHGLLEVSHPFPLFAGPLLDYALT
jgi:hypothetical protein